MDIVVTGYAGYDGSLKILNNEFFRKRLLDQYNESFFAVFEDNNSSRFKDAAESIADLFSQRYALPNQDCRDGGFLAALWRLTHRAGAGAVFSQRRVPILQQTVEICEHTGLDPYRLTAESCRVWLTEDAGTLLEECAAAGVPAGVAGHTTAGVAVKRIDNPETAFLRRPEPDQIRRLFPDFEMTAGSY